jgi:hypothetical protein
MQRIVVVAQGREARFSARDVVGSFTRQLVPLSNSKLYPATGQSAEGKLWLGVSAIAWL